MHETGVVVFDSKPWMIERLQQGLDLLMRVTHYVETGSCDGRQLAIKLAELSEAGLDVIDCRWLVSQGLMEHLNETTYPGDFHRTFRKGDANITHCSCFLLTTLGVTFASNLRCSIKKKFDTQSESGSDTDRDVSNSVSASESQFPQPVPQQPLWDSQRQELFFEGRLVKQYRSPSPNQVAILNAFQEENWPSRIDDPLPQNSQIDPRRRLNDTIRNLNRSRVNLLIWFSGDGTGEGILWNCSTKGDAHSPC